MIRLKQSRDRLLPLVIAGLAFALRVYRLDFQSLWRDEVDVLRFATRPLLESMAMIAKPGENGPLFYLALRPWLEAAGQTEFALRFPSACAGTLAVAALYSLVRRIAGAQPALLAALFAATAPFLVWYGQDAKMYAPITALVTLTLWQVTEVVRRGGPLRWVLLYVLTTVSFLVHLLAVLVVPVQAVWLLLLPARQGAGRWRAVVSYLALLILPYVVLLGWTARFWLERADPERYAFVPLIDVFAVMAARFSQGILPGASPEMFPFLLALVAGVALWPHLRGRAGRQAVLLMAAWLVLPLLAISVVSLRVPMFLDRYMIWTMPAFLALTGMGVCALLRAWRPLGLMTAGAVLALNIVGVWEQGHQPVKSDFRAAAQFVAAHAQAGDRLIFQMPYNRFTFTYYYGELPTWVDGPYTNGGMPEAEVDGYLAREVGSAPGVWLVDSEAALWDEDGLVQAWLEEHGTRTAQAELARVAVTRYQLTR
jgi:4-amino-4-deoxy-L-arabinose transferase-like glycosyltransferase